MTRTTSDQPALHDPRVFLALIVAGALLIAIFLTSNIVNSETGGISATVRIAGIGLALACLVRPKFGLYVVTIEAFSLDYIKKIAVYYGAADMNTVIEVLVVGMLAVSATIAGVLSQSVVFRRYKLTRLHWAVLAAAGVCFAAVVLALRNSVGFTKAVEAGFDAGIYIGLIVPMCLFLTDRAQLDKLLTLQFWLATIWAACGIYQYYYGFTRMDWFYAETGLSLVSSEHMLRFADPRPFGFGSGSPNYGVIGSYFCYGVWRCWHGTARRNWMLLGSAVLFWGMVTSMQRTTLLLPFVAFPVYFLFRNPLRTIWTYAAVVILFPVAVYFSEELLSSLDEINALIATPGHWAENVLVVSTYSDRIHSWEWLKKGSSYTLFGIDEEVGSHDIFSRVLLSYGVFGLLGLLCFLAVSAWYLHRMVLRVTDRETRAYVTFMLALTATTTFLSLTGGGNFTTVPINLQIWTFLGALVAMISNTELFQYEPKPDVADDRRTAHRATHLAPLAAPRPGAVRPW